jgi:hypothetical protein
MTALMSQRVVEALGDLEQLQQEIREKQSLSEPSIQKFESIKEVMLHMLHALTGSAHPTETN